MAKIIRKLYLGIVYIGLLVLIFFSFPFAYAIYYKKKIWLISEVDFDARDNGFALFKYLCKNHPEINSIFLISKKNIFYEKVKAVGKTIEPKTYKHLLIFIAAKAKISTIVHGCSPSSLFTQLFLIKHHFTGKNIALKHGIFKNKHPNYFKQNAHLDMICCGAYPEFKYIENEFGYQKGVACYTGLARFDELHNFDVKNEILIMPTWRRWLEKIKDNNDFEKTSFYKEWKGFMQNKTFNSLINKNNITVNFYLHPKLNNYISSFSKISSNIKFFSSQKGDDLQDLLKKTRLLITDFSSVFFDFAYMKKPLIHFQFDEVEFNKHHYLKGYFDYRKDGFGDVCTNKNELIYSIKKVFSTNFMLAKKYYKRVINFFALNDQANCERIYSYILKSVNHHK